MPAPRKDFLELVVINNAHRLSFDCLEATNDFRKKHNIVVVLLAVPDFDRKIRLFDPVGCDVALYQEYSPPRAEELRQILEIPPYIVSSAYGTGRAKIEARSRASQRGC